MTRKNKSIIFPAIVLTLIIVILIWFYASINSGDFKTTLYEYLKGDGLKWVIGSIVFIVFYMIIKRILKIFGIYI